MTINALSSSGLGALQAKTAYSIPVGAVVRSFEAIGPSVARLKPPPAFAPPVPLDPAVMMATMSQAGVTPDNDPSKLFAEVYKNGQVAARIYNGGTSTAYGSANGIIDGVNEPFDGGPDLAQWRAAKIARELGGTVKMAASAQTQSQWQITNAAESARRDHVMAPQRAAMNAFLAAIRRMVDADPVQSSVIA